MPPLSSTEVGMSTKVLWDSKTPARRTVLADLGTSPIPPFHSTRSPHPEIWRIFGVGAEAVRQTRRLWPAAGVGVGAPGVVGTDGPVPAVAVDEQAILGAGDAWMEGGE